MSPQDATTSSTAVRASTPIVGWRGWYTLKPCHLFTNNWLWPIRERLEAVCEERGGHDAPHGQCSCGIYAFKTAEDVRLQNYSSQPILGEVWLWGRVLEHKHGFKAQYAYPKKFWLRKEDKLNQYIAWTYGVECEVVEEHPMWTVPPPPPPPPPPPTAAEIRAQLKGLTRAQKDTLVQQLAAIKTGQLLWTPGKS